MRKTILLLTILLLSCTSIETPMKDRDDMMHVERDAMPDMHKQMMGNRATRMPAQGLQASNAKPGSVIALHDGAELELSADVVTKTIAGHELKLYGYNGQLPGPLFKVKQGDTITVHFTNNIDLNTTVHWHGLRHANKDDGVPDVTQAPVQPGERFTYELYFPDDGIFWYHPHIREDLQQDAGLAGNMWALPQNAWNDVDAEEMLVLDDILLTEEGLAPYGNNHGNRLLMGRFGNIMLVNWQESYALNATRGETVRFYVTNIANTRVFNISFTNARIKRVGGDIGLYERDEFIDSLVIAPAERYIIEVQFTGPSTLLHINPHRTYELGSVTVKDGELQTFTENEHDHVIEDIAQFTQYFDKPIDHQLNLTLDLDMPMEHGATHIEPIEWEDTMAMMNAMSDTNNVRWIIRDDASGNENMNLSIKASVGDVVKIRLFNDANSAHPMQHPIHLHGQRFLIVNRNGVEEENKVWKDTVLVPAGEYVDILVDVTNPGDWMLHCHISEHLEAGMMSLLKVE